MSIRDPGDPSRLNTLSYDPPVVVEPPVSVPTPSPRPFHVRRIARTGTILLFGGVMLFALGEVFVALQTYVFFANPSFSTIDQSELYTAIGALLTLLGAVIAAVGWVVDQGVVARATTAWGRFTYGSRWIAGVALVLVGAGLVAVCSGFSAYVAFTAYYQVTLNLWRYTFVVFEFVLAFGYLFIGVGWLVQHVARLEQLERPVP